MWSKFIEDSGLDMAYLNQFTPHLGELFGDSIYSKMDENAHGFDLDFQVPKIPHSQQM